MFMDRQTFVHRANALFYDPGLEIAEITTEDREFCLGLLKKFDFSCVAGCAGSVSATVQELATEAVADSVGLAEMAGPAHFLTGPHPEIESGIGIWVTRK